MVLTLADHVFGQGGEKLHMDKGRPQNLHKGMNVFAINGIRTVLRNMLPFGGSRYGEGSAIRVRNPVTQGSSVVTGSVEQQPVPLDGAEGEALQ